MMCTRTIATGAGITGIADCPPAFVRSSSLGPLGLWCCAVSSPVAFIFVAARERPVPCRGTVNPSHDEDQFRPTYRVRCVRYKRFTYLQRPVNPSARFRPRCKKLSVSRVPVALAAVCGWLAQIII